jgi:putative ABC transport system permease protein
LSRHRLRTAFIMLSSLVGVAALTFVLLVGQAARSKLLTTIQQIFGDSSIVVVAGGNELMAGPRPDAARLTIDDVEAIVAALPEVDAWDPQQTMTGSVRHGGGATTARVLGQSERAEVVWGRSVSRGVFFDAGAVKRLDRVALVGETIVRDVFQSADPIGAELMIESVPFTVIGVLEPFGTDIHGLDRDNEVVVPITTFLRRVANVDTIAAAKLHVSDSARVEAVAEELREQLRIRHALAAGRPDDFELLTPVEVQRLVNKASQVLSLYLPMAAVIVLFVGGLVAATLMLGAVNARVAEIGLRRAIGAEPRHIALQFLAETMVTVVGGGVAGIVLGLVAGRIVANHLHLEMAFAWGPVGLGLLMAAVTGVLAGVLPARRAAGLQPAEALR